MDVAIMYRDFFEAPRGVRGKVGETNAGKGKGNGKGKGVDRKKKGKGKSVKFVKDDLMEDEVEEDDEEGEDGGRDVMGRVKGDLFDESDEEEDENSEHGLVIPLAYILTRNRSFNPREATASIGKTDCRARTRSHRTKRLDVAR